MKRLTILVSTAVLALTACGPKECVLTDPASCPSDQVCEQVQGKEKPLCFAPVTMKGKVYDLATSSGIEKAQVLATDENGSPAGAPTETAADGTYTLKIPSVRTDEKGAYVSRKVLLRSQAKNYVPFPSGSRISLPVDTSSATREKETDPYVVQSAQTDIGLNPVETNAQNLPTVSGTVEVTGDLAKSIMVVLEKSGSPGRTTLAGTDGKFTFFNVPAGDWKAAAYTRGQNYTAAAVSVASADVTGVEIKKSSVTPANLSGSVQLVAGANGDGTSVVLVVRSTFIEALGRGEVPPGLRAPESGPPTVTGAWTISGIPDGSYVVLAAFENDGNVRDPDPGISGTQVQYITVSGGQISGGTDPAFKVTAAVGLVSPGKDGVEEVGATPTFTWLKHSNADGYALRVYDSLGNQVWEKIILDGATVSSVYAGPALTVGQFYQWRVTAYRRLAPTSFTEELRGLFRVK